MMKKPLSMLLICCVLFSYLSVSASAAGMMGTADVEAGISRILSVYPAGSQFTKDGYACGHISSLGCQNCTLSNIPSRGGLPSGAEVIRVCVDGSTCIGFARYVFYTLFGISEKDSRNTTVNGLGSAVVGDYIRCLKSTGEFAHAGIFVGWAEPGVSYYLYESNHGSANKVAYKSTLYTINNNSEHWTSYTTTHAYNYIGDNISVDDINNDHTAPVVQSAVISASSSLGISVNCVATDNVYLKQIKFGIWNSAIGIDKAVWDYIPARSGEEISHFIDFSRFGNPTDVTYYINVVAEDFAGNSSNYVRAGEFHRETVPPVVNSAKITNVTPLGYDIVCTASDNSKLSGITVGTWHDNMHVDNAVWETVSVNGNTATVHINLAKFSYAQGTTYHNNVYAIDANGNLSAAVGGGDPYIENDLSQIVKMTNISPMRGYDLTCTAVGYPSAARMAVGTWHDQMDSSTAVWLDQTGTQCTFHIDISKFNNAINVTYHTNLYIIDSEGKWSEAIRAADIMIENIPPVVTSATVENVTSDGYDVVCTVSDNSKVKKVSIGTWHEKITTHEAKWDETEVIGNKAILHVDVSKFGNQRDVVYYTNVYAYDECGNISEAVLAGRTYVAERRELALSHTNILLDLYTAEKATVTASYVSSDVVPTRLTWTSDDTDVVTVENGVITPVGVGVATITCTAPGGTTATCEVEVVDHTPFFTFAENGSAIVSGSNARISGTVTALNASIEDVSEVGVKLMDRYGILLAYRSGAPTISNDRIDITCDVNDSLGMTLTPDTTFKYQFYLTYNGKEYSSQSFSFTTAKEIAISGITLSAESLTFDLADPQTATLTASYLPENATETTLAWSSDNTEVATVEDGVVTPVAAGTATITCTAPSGVSAACTVEVENSRALKSLSISHSKVTLTNKDYGMRRQLTLSFEPANATHGILHYTSTNRQVAQIGLIVNERVVVIGKAPGTAVLTLTDQQSGLSVSFEVIVRDDLSTLTLPANTVTIGSEAFRGTAAELVVLPETTVSIGRSAFADSEYLLYVSIPAGVADIDPLAFDNCCEELCLLVTRNSPADAYALEHGIDVQYQ